jgi:ribosomal protein L37AE/L43A
VEKVIVEKSGSSFIILFPDWITDSIAAMIEAEYGITWRTKDMENKALYGDLGLADHYTCYYCKLGHKKVEAGGVWHCPNVACSGPGAHYHRRKLLSYKETGDGKHTVDWGEWKMMAEEFLKENKDPLLVDAVKASLKKIATHATSKKFGL